MGTLWIVLICFLVPLGGALFLHLRYKMKYIFFLSGALAFFVSQIVLRLPLLSYLQSQAFFVPFMMNQVPYLLFLSFSAGVFEEGARFLAMLFFRRYQGVKKAVMFGLGHGGIEAILLVGIPLLGQGVDMQTGFLAGSERCFAMIAHVCLSLLVYKGVKEHKFRYVLLSVFAHGAFNFIPIYLGMKFNLSTVTVEGILGICTCILVGVAYWSNAERKKI